MDTIDSYDSFKKQRYISFGPSCLSAEVLKACSLRYCTFGFDWFRSGSYHHLKFFNLELGEFLRNYVYSISFPLRQESDPSQLSNKTSEYKELKQIYGYNVLYNPHRNYCKETYSYFERSFMRLRYRLEGKFEGFEAPTLVMTDYLNKKHYRYFDDSDMAAAYLRYNCLMGFNYMPNVKILRFNLVEDKDFNSESVEAKLREHHMEYIVPVSHTIDSDTEMRRLFYKSLCSIFTE